MAFRLICFLCLSISSTALLGQNSQDVLRYSLLDISGSARVQALGGAFNALGGDVSSLGLNPAASAVLLSSTSSFGFGLNTQNNTQSYFGTKINNQDHHFGLIHAGGVIVTENTVTSSPWRKFSLGFNVNRQNNMTEDFFSSGQSSNTLGLFFQEQAQGIPLSDLQLYPGETISSAYSYLGETQGTRAQNAFLGYQGYLIDPVSDDATNTSYVPTLEASNVQHEVAAYNHGDMRKYSLNFSAQYGQNLFLGINFNSHDLKFRSQSQVRELALNNSSRSLYFENNLGVIGEGLSIQLGGIFAWRKHWRISATYDTPTWWNIAEESTQYLQTTRRVNGENVVTTLNPDVVNIYDTYQMKTPGKIATGLAYIFDKSGLISLEYGQKNYSKAALGPKTYGYYTEVNEDIKREFRNAQFVKIGGEYRWNVWRLRGGFWHEESPLVNDKNTGPYSGKSIGIGYTYRSLALDMTYISTQRNANQTLFVPQNQIQRQEVNNLLMCSLSLSL